MKELSWKDYFYTPGNTIERLKELIDHPKLNEFDYFRDATIQRFKLCLKILTTNLKTNIIYE